MATLILGHGGFDPTGTPPEVLVPPGIVFSTYSDTGNVLMIPATRDANGELLFDYTNLASGWDHYTPYGSLTERMVVSNFSLGALEPAEIELAKKLDWGGAVVLCVGDAIEPDFGLCRGDENSCPTPALLVEENENPGSVPEERWLHNCDGILGDWGAQTDRDIHWVACTSIVADEVAPGIAGENDLDDAAP